MINAKTLRIGGITIATLLVVLFIVFHRPANSPDFPDGLYYLCQNPSCEASKTGFAMTVKQYSDFQLQHYGERVKCPICGQQKTVRAYKCKHCGNVWVAKQGENICPKCKTPREVPTD
jgi:hypothetical protein